jgi:hypothetical protein
VKPFSPERSGLETEARREKITADISARTGIDEAMNENLVRRFYAKVREDAVLGPIFDTKIHDWEPHLERMCAFRDRADMGHCTAHVAFDPNAAAGAAFEATLESLSSD